MRRNSVNSASGLKQPSSTCSATTISYKRTKIVAISQHRKRAFGSFLPRMRRNSYLGTSGQKSEMAFASATSISYKTDPFSLPSDVYWIYSMFGCYYVAWPCDLDIWPFNLESVTCTVLLMSDPHTDFYYPTSIGHWVTSTEYLLTFPLYETVTAHASCHVTSNRGQK